MEREMEIKTEPLDFEDAIPTDFLVVKTEVTDYNSNNSNVCQKCGVPQRSAVSLRNHFALCRKNNDPTSVLPSGNVDHGNRRGLKILEQSCFSDCADFDPEKRDGKSFQCRICPHESPFESEGLFARHLYAHTYVVVPGSGDENRVICPDCGKVFHQNEFHHEGKSCLSKTKTVQDCGICGVLFLRKDALREHLKAHAGLREFAAVHTCADCGVKFGGASLLTLHSRMHKDFKKTANKTGKK